MARTPAIHSATSQFFINLRDNVGLDHKDKTDRGFGYAVYGQVIEGLDVMDEIAKVTTGSVAGHKDVPKEPIVVTKAYVVGEEAGEAEKTD
jgi:cyclophilin family peptidyl-prolyl cis-trans isomerase